MRQPIAITLVAALLLQGCVPYTSNYKPTPGGGRKVVGLDRPAAQAGPARIDIVGSPTAMSPADPLAFRVARTLTGPEANITTTRENAYKRSWTPLIIPVGVLLIGISPVLLVFAGLSNGNDAMDKLIGLDADPCKHGFFGFAALTFVGIIDSCEIADSRTGEEKEPTGKTVSEEAGVPDVKLDVRLQATGEEPVVRTLQTDAGGNASLEIGPLFRSFRAEPGNVDVVVRSAGNGGLEQTARIEAGASRRLFTPFSEERAGDRALSEGEGLVALDHFTRALQNCAGSSAESALRKKTFATYRALPLKPPVPEEARRLVVQAETLAKNNDASGAIGKLTEAVRTTPWLPVARYNLAMAQAMAGDYGAAIGAMNVYLELAPDSPDARQAKDKVYEWEAMKPTSTPPAAGEGGRGRPALPGGGRGRR